jgi:hypothetical protein
MKDDQEVYEKLYNTYKEQQVKLKKKKETIQNQKAEAEIAECTFKPVKVSTDPNNKSMDKSTLSSERQRKGYEDYIRRARNGTRETFRKKYLKNK